MDPITGVSLVAAVLQLVQFSIKTAKACHEIYAQGSASDFVDIDDTATRLGNLSGSLQQSIRDSEARNPRLSLSKAEIDLIDLGQKCRICANKLHHELIKLRARPRGSRREAMQKFARSVWRHGSITKLQEQLENHRRVLESTLLFRLYERFDIESLKASDGFAKLDKALQDIIRSLAISQNSQATLVQQGSERTLRHLSESFARLETLQKEERFYRDIKDSLFYPDIFSREEQIVHEFDGMEDSYEWIFGDPSDPLDKTWQDYENYEVSRKNPRWDNFSGWLETGNTVYWINGKAGSGKSTLMHHIYKHECTVEHLKQWGAGKLLLTAAFFFWNAGGRQQKTTDGLLRSLIYQMLIKCPQLIACFDKNEPFHAWTETRLLNTLVSFLTQTWVDIAVFLCIDGLDELEGDYTNVLKTISSLSAQTHVKICLSSRPLWVFENAFAGMPSLRLQDLTYNSICAYTHSRLIDKIEPRYFESATDNIHKKHLMAKIVKRAEGVFLWVVVAVRNLREGLQDLVDIGELERDIERLPASIEDLYIQLLNRIKPMYRRDAARFLQIALNATTTLDVQIMCFIDQEQVKGDVPLVFESFHERILVEACYRMKTRVLSHTLGLLDVVPRHSSNGFLKTDDLESRSIGEIKIYHRTVRDFFIDNDKAKDFLREAGPEEHICLSIARGTFIYLMSFSQYDRRIMQKSMFPHYNYLCLVMNWISLAERLIGTAQSDLMESLLSYSSMFEIIEDRTSPMQFASAFKIQECSVIKFDVVGMAAYRNMLLFICKLLNIPTAQSQSNPKRLSDCRYSYHRSDPLVLVLEWVSAPKYGGSLSSYRRELGKSLRWHMRTQATQQVFRQRVSENVAETYLLACCQPSLYDKELKRGLILARMLLEAGADPMVRIESSVNNLEPDTVGRNEVFWANWIKFLMQYLKAKRSSHNLPAAFMESLATLDDIFDTTKALLAQGAYVNYQIKVSKAYCTSDNTDLSGFYDYVIVCESTSAILVLEECFSEYHEFQDFATNVQRVFERPWRRVSYFYYAESTTGDYEDYGGAFRESFIGETERRGEPYIPNEDESELLLPLIDEYKKSGEKIAMLEAFRRIWRAHRPDMEIDDISEMKISESEGLSEEVELSEKAELSEREELSKEEKELPKKELPEKELPEKELPEKELPEKELPEKELPEKEEHRRSSF